MLQNDLFLTAGTQTYHYAQWMEALTSCRQHSEWSKKHKSYILGRREVWIIWFADFWLPLESCLMIAGNKGAIISPALPPHACSCQSTSCLPHVRYSIQKCIVHFILSFTQSGASEKVVSQFYKSVFSLHHSHFSPTLHLSFLCPPHAPDRGITD